MARCLAARCLAKEARVLDPKGRPFTDNDIGSALAMRDLLGELRQGGVVTGGPLGVVRAGSVAVRRVQTGYLRYYAAAMIIGMSAVAAYFLLSST